MKIEKVRTGVILMRGDKAWLGADTRYEDASDGWGDATQAELNEPEFCTKPYDLSSPPGHLVEEMSKGKLVLVRKVVAIEVIGDA